jgi:hypothetical protein
MIQPRGSPAFKQDADVRVQPIGTYEFVLKPGSTGYIKMAYDFCPTYFGFHPSRTANYTELNKLIQRPDQIIHKLNDKLNNTENSGYPFQLPLASDDQQLLTGVNATDVGLRVHASDLTKLNSHALSATFTIFAEPNANMTTYIFTMYGICPGEILTVGEMPNDRSLEWAKGPFYGCHG